jgi:hypothetical protein
VLSAQKLLLLSRQYEHELHSINFINRHKKHGAARHLQMPQLEHTDLQPFNARLQHHQTALAPRPFITNVHIMQSLCSSIGRG